jgi:hypothetical protein
MSASIAEVSQTKSIMTSPNSFGDKSRAKSTTQRTRSVERVNLNSLKQADKEYKAKIKNARSRLDCWNNNSTTKNTAIRPSEEREQSKDNTFASAVEKAQNNTIGFEETESHNSASPIKDRIN